MRDKRWLWILCLLTTILLAGCGRENAGGSKTFMKTEEKEIVKDTGAAQGQGEGSGESGPGEEEGVTMRIGALKGPTTMGLLFLMEKQKRGETKNAYEFQMATGADELLPLMASGKLDVCLVPANVAAILYQKTAGQVTVIDVNTLGVLYLISGDPLVKGMGDLKGRTVYLTGKGTTPDYVLRYLLAGAGFSEEDVKLEYRTEATEVAAILAKEPGAVGFLPQPFVTAACMQNEALSVVASANEEWLKLQGEGGTGLVTGVTVVRKAFLEERPRAVESFLEEHAASAEAINRDPVTGGQYCVRAGIVGKEAIAEKAIPQCNVTCITGEEMKTMLKAYLEILADFDAATVGGKLPEEDFYGSVGP